VSAPGWLLIAEFARRCRLPVSTLRYYDRVGLLRPAEVDARSGYRRYSADQLPTAVTIARLRSIGTSPDTIARILAGGPGAVAALAAERARITDEITRRADALHRLDELAGGRPPTPARPRRVELAAAYVPALAFGADTADLAAAITRGVAGLRARLRHREVRVLNDEEQVLEFLGTPLPIYLFVSAQAWETLEDKVQGPHRLLARHRDLYKGIDVLVITNQGAVSAGQVEPFSR